MPDDILNGIEGQPENVQRALMIAAIRALSSKFDRLTTALYSLVLTVIGAVIVYLITTSIGGHG